MCYSHIVVVVSWLYYTNEQQVIINLYQLVNVKYMSCVCVCGGGELPICMCVCVCVCVRPSAL